MQPGLRKVEPIPDREDRFKIRTFCFLEFATHEDAAVVFKRHQVAPPPPAPAQKDNSSISAARVLSQEQAALGSRGAPAGEDVVGSSPFFERETQVVNNSNSSSSSVGGGGGGALEVAGGGDCATPSAASSLDAVSSGMQFEFDTRGLRDPGGGEQRSRWGGHTEDDPGGGSIGFASHGESNSECRSAICQQDTRGGVVGPDAFSSWGKKAVEANDGGSSGGGGGVPLVVGGAVLKVDWADPLRYHIHLNGGIKGPSAPSEIGMPDNRASLRGGCGVARGMMPGAGVGGFRGGYAAGRGWPQQSPQQGVMRHPSDPRWPQESEHTRMTRPGQQQQQRQYHHHQQQLQRLDLPPSRRHSQSTHPYGGPPPASPLERRQRGYTIADSRSASTLGATSASRRSPSFYGDVSSSAASLGQQQHDFGGRTRATSSSGVPPPHHGAAPQASFLSGDPEQDFGASAVDAHLQPVHARFQPHQRQTDRPASAPGDAQDDLAGWYRAHDVVGGQGSSRGHRGVGRLAGRSYSASPESSGPQDSFPSSSSAGGAGGGGVGGGGPHTLLLSRSVSHPRSEEHAPPARRGGLPSWETQLGTRSSWPQRAQGDGDLSGGGAGARANVARRSSGSWLDPSGGMDAGVVLRQAGERRTSTAAHEPTSLKQVEGLSFGGRQGSLQQQPRQRWEQGWPAEGGGHLVSKSAALMHPKVRVFLTCV